MADKTACIDIRAPSMEGQKSGIESIHLNEELIYTHPQIIDKYLPSLEAHVTYDGPQPWPVILVSVEFAARKAIAEWGRSATDITHLIFSTYFGCRALSMDLQLVTLLGLHPSISRIILSTHSCSGSGRALQLAKEIAENIYTYRQPSIKALLDFS
uniref:Chalcone/stilbene synthase N-terminal domain-containing protein n=1 Tax=Oryza glumipatula TaxID=40148 RepID=A0A0E0B8E8_9ORYZ